MSWITVFLPIKKWAYLLKLLHDNGKAFKLCLPSTNESSCRLMIHEDGMPYIHQAMNTAA